MHSEEIWRERNEKSTTKDRNLGMKRTIARSNNKGNDAMEKRMSHNVMK
jgi:hypothetical protein